MENKQNYPLLFLQSGSPDSSLPEKHMNARLETFHHGNVLSTYCMLALEGKKVRLSHTRKSLKYEGRQTTWDEQGGNGAMDNPSRKAGVTHEYPRTI